MNDKVKILKSKGLGRGLSALIQETNKEFKSTVVKPANDSDESAKRLALSDIQPWKLQPRTHIAEEELNELANSIKINGVVQPILVRKNKNDSGYEIIAGERRWRASGIAGLSNIPAIIMEVTDKQAFEIALIENIQRQNLMALEVAEGYRRLIEEYSYTQEELSEVVGKSRAQVSNSLRLLTLPEEVKDLLNQDKISAGHARALLNAEEPLELAKKIVKRGLSVRQIETLVQKVAKFPKAPIIRERDEDTAKVENILTRVLGVKVSIQAKGSSGKVILSYGSLEQLSKIINRLSKLG